MCLNSRDVTDPMGMSGSSPLKATELRLVVRKFALFQRLATRGRGVPVQRPKSPTLLPTENHWGRAADRGKGLHVKLQSSDSHREMSHVLSDHLGSVCA